MNLIECIVLVQFAAEPETAEPGDRLADVVDESVFTEQRSLPRLKEIESSIFCQAVFPKKDNIQFYEYFSGYLILNLNLLQNTCFWNECIFIQHDEVSRHNCRY